MLKPTLTSPSFTIPPSRGTYAWLHNHASRMYDNMVERARELMTIGKNRSVPDYFERKKLPLNKNTFIEEFISDYYIDGVYVDQEKYMIHRIHRQSHLLEGDVFEIAYTLHMWEFEYRNNTLYSTEHIPRDYRNQPTEYRLYYFKTYLKWFTNPKTKNCFKGAIRAGL